MAQLSLVCDFQGLYRHLIDDFLINYCRRITPKDFKTKTESASHGKRGKREYLTDSETKMMLDHLNRYFETMVEVKRIRNGEHQIIARECIKALGFLTKTKATISRAIMISRF
jgi:CRISPR/Cas system-associated endonuclease Cas1